MKDLISLSNTITSPKKTFGQGMTEYIIIVALVAVAAIGSFKIFGETARAQIAGLSAELAGENADTAIAAAEASAEAAQAEAGQQDERPVRH